jgi:hypothetical protein
MLDHFLHTCLDATWPHGLKTWVGRALQQMADSKAKAIGTKAPFSRHRGHGLMSKISTLLKRKKCKRIMKLIEIIVSVEIIRLLLTYLEVIYGIHARVHSWGIRTLYFLLPNVHNLS